LLGNEEVQFQRPGLGLENNNNKTNLELTICHVLCKDLTSTKPLKLHNRDYYYSCFMGERGHCHTARLVGGRACVGSQEG
jgi:hypothetical protein